MSHDSALLLSQSVAIYCLWESPEFLYFRFPIPFLFHFSYFLLPSFYLLHFSFLQTYLLSTCLTFFFFKQFISLINTMVYRVFSLHSVDLAPFFSFLFFSRIKSRANVVHILISSIFFLFFSPIIPFLYNSNTGLSLELNP